MGRGISCDKSLGAWPSSKGAGRIRSAPTRRQNAYMGSRSLHPNEMTEGLGLLRCIPAGVVQWDYEARGGGELARGDSDSKKDLVGRVNVHCNVKAKWTKMKLRRWYLGREVKQLTTGGGKSPALAIES